MATYVRIHERLKSPPSNSWIWRDAATIVVVLASAAIILGSARFPNVWILSLAAVFIAVPPLIWVATKKENIFTKRKKIDLMEYRRVRGEGNDLDLSFDQAYSLLKTELAHQLNTVSRYLLDNIDIDDDEFARITEAINQLANAFENFPDDVEHTRASRLSAIFNFQEPLHEYIYHFAQEITGWRHALEDEDQNSRRARLWESKSRFDNIIFSIIESRPYAGKERAHSPEEERQAAEIAAQAILFLQNSFSPAVQGILRAQH